MTLQTGLWVLLVMPLLLNVSTVFLCYLGYELEEGHTDSVVMAFVFVPLLLGFGILMMSGSFQDRFTRFIFVTRLITTSIPSILSMSSTP